MITLIIVDCQNDYLTGTMSMKGSRNIIEPIKKFIKLHKDDIEKIVFTAEWLPYNHRSFKQFGGDLQHHCIQFTPGACIEPKLLKYVQSLNLNYIVSTRDLEEEQIGAFKDVLYVEDCLSKRYYLDEIDVNANTNFVVCGIYGDKNVETTLSNLITGGISPQIFMPGVYSTDGGKLLSQFIKENNIEKIV